MSSRNMSSLGPRKAFVGSQLYDGQTTTKNLSHLHPKLEEGRNRLLQLSWCPSLKRVGVENRTRQVGSLPHTSRTVHFVEGAYDSKVNYSSTGLLTRKLANPRFDLLVYVLLAVCDFLRPAYLLKSASTCDYNPGSRLP